MSDGKLKSTAIVAPSCESTGPTPDATPMSEKSVPTTWNQSMLFAADSLAKTFHSPALAPDWTAPEAASGSNTRASFASYDHVTSSWRTSQRCLDGGLERFSESWPRAGTTRNGIAFPRVPLAPLTRETGCGLLPTPVTVDSGSYFNRSASSGAALRPTLGAMAKHGLWPTPTSRDHKDGTAKSCANVPANGLLGRVVHEGSTHLGSLNPAWVEWLMGYPLGWTVLGGSAMPSSRRSRSGSRSGSKKRR